jgi:cytochrome c7-like protein/class III cytochrome C family protein
MTKSTVWWPSFDPSARSDGRAVNFAAKSSTSLDRRRAHGQTPSNFTIWIGAALVLLTLPILAGRTKAEEKGVQPILFSHKRHAGELGFSCTVCHQSVESQTFAGLPQADTCMTCHAAVILKSVRKHKPLSPEMAKLKGFAQNSGEIPWLPIYRQPPYVFFSHRRHVVVAKIECARCHGDMPSQAVPLTQPLVHQTMQWCTKCHQQRHASLDCDSCHR